MKNNLKLFICSFFIITVVHAQNFIDSYEYSFSIKAEKPNPIKYNAFGLSDPSDQKMIGGNHVSFRKIGYGFSWRVGAKFIQESYEKSGDVPLDTAIKNGWLTGNKSVNYAYSLMPGFAFAITKKIPLMLSVGVIRQRQLEEYLATSNLQTGWSINNRETKFNFNFSAQTFIPLSHSIILNLGYDHVPQSYFIGIAISHKHNFVDIDEW